MQFKLKRCFGTLVILMMSLGMFAQGSAVREELPRGWHLMDKEKDGFYGISLDKAYQWLQSKNLKSKPVIVAIIDGGIDTLQEDLKNLLWTNPREIAGNGLDDDHNGYVDDIHGWNFLGGKDGKSVTDDSGEDARVYYRDKNKFEAPGFNPANLSGDEQDRYSMWVRAKKRIIGEGPENNIDVVFLKRVLISAQNGDSLLQKEMGKTEYTGNDLDSFETKSYETKRAKAALLYLFKADNLMDVTNKSFLSDFSELVKEEERKEEAKNTAPKDIRKEIVGDNEEDINDRSYGNNDIMAADPMHGTHVAGIIGAQRNNGKGIDGIADNVRIMMIRAVPNGDEHDKDIALGIRYAVDNGARVVNMSFGKHFSPYKKWVDDAVKYAQSKGVLLVEAAGNDYENTDSVDVFPNPQFKDSKLKATNWITVGASSDPLADARFKSLTAYFSNYGKHTVDVFAPGAKIYSTLPGGNQYGNLSGTSMAAPVVTGVAALIMEYFPTLTAEQVKLCIEKSAVAPAVKVRKPGSDNEMVSLSELCKSGGIINAYGAIKLAAQLSEENKQKEMLPKSTLENKKG